MLCIDKVRIMPTLHGAKLSSCGFSSKSVAANLLPTSQVEGLGNTCDKKYAESTGALESLSSYQGPIESYACMGVEASRLSSLLSISHCALHHKRHQKHTCNCLPCVNDPIFNEIGCMSTNNNPCQSRSRRNGSRKCSEILVLCIFRRSQRLFDLEAVV